MIKGIYMTHYSLQKDKIKILLLEGLHQSAVDTFINAGYTNIESIKTALSEDELCQKIKNVHFIGIRSRTDLNANVIAAAEKLVGIGCFCIGTNQVDLVAAQNAAIPVFNAPFSNTRSVAELVLGQIILLLRGIPEKNAKAHRGEWQKSATNSYEARGKQLGIIGYGHIGFQLSILAENLGLSVKYYDIESKLPLGNAEQSICMQELLATSDIITLHVPETSQTQLMMGQVEFAQMKQGSIFINASRGTVVDIDALATALETNKISGAAIDVFPMEPSSNNDEFISPLRKFDNVILTPHVGGSTQEAQKNIGYEVSGKLIKYSDNGSTLSAVNFPEVSLPTHQGLCRLMHIHFNRPGILNQITQEFKENKIYISAHYLQTIGDIGYVVIDVESESSELAFTKIKSINGTIRARLLK